MHFQQRGLPPKKPSQGVKGQGKLETQRNREETRAVFALKEMEQAKQELRQLQKRLQDLDFELRGGCVW